MIRRLGVDVNEEPPVIVPFMCAWTLPSSVAVATNSVPAASSPTVPPSTLAVT